MLKGIIVDDEERIINGLKRHIKWDDLGISIVDSAINGKEGLEKVRLHNPDLVITDIKMPLMDGLKFIEKIKSEGYNPKVIVLTGHGEFDYAKESIKLGVVDYILKPFMPDEVYPIFQKAVDICIKEKEKEEQLESLHKMLNEDILNLYNKEELVEALKSRDLSQINKCTSEMFTKAKGQKYINIDYIKAAVMEMLGIVSITLFQIGENKDVTKFLVDRLNEIGDKEDIDKLEAWLEEFFEQILDSMSGKTKQRYSRVVEQIIDVIKENYSKEISLEDISKIIYLTPNYLSNIFSNTMGESFTKYLSRYRVEKAKEFLSSGKYKIYEVCEMVGYRNVDHFRKIFKEFTGKTPSEY